MKIFYVAFLTALLSYMQCFCLDKLTIGFCVQNSTAKNLRVVSQSDSVKFTDGILEKTDELFDASKAKSCVLILNKNQITTSAKKIEVKDGETQLFSIEVSFVDDSPKLKIVDVTDESFKRKLYIPLVGGGYSYVLAVGNDDSSVSSDSMKKLQPFYTQSYQPVE